VAEIFGNAQLIDEIEVFSASSDPVDETAFEEDAEKLEKLSEVNPVP
jgi:hypothetical protein